MEYSQGRHAQQLQEAYLQLAAEHLPQPNPAPIASVNVLHLSRRCSESQGVLLAATAVLALSVLLITRPPFVLTFERNARQPWRGVVRLSWFSLLVTVLLTLTVATGLPLLAATLATGGT